MSEEKDLTPDHLDPTLPSPSQGEGTNLLSSPYQEKGTRIVSSPSQEEGIGIASSPSQGEEAGIKSSPLQGEGWEGLHEGRGEKSNTGWKRWARRLSFGLSLLLGLFLAFCYVRRPDACAAVTVWPVWVWVAPGLLFATLACERKQTRPLKFGALYWLLFVLIFAEEPRSLLRFRAERPPNWETLRRDGRALRVISINCAGGVKEALLEAAALEPDLILVQERPDRAAVQEAARRLFGSEGSVLTGLDCALIVHGKLKPTALPPRVGFFTQARIELASGPEIEAISVHTITPPLQTDLWNPAVWQAYRTHREDQRNQMQKLARQIAKVPDAVPMIVGGDFNAPQGDAVFRLLQPRLRDTFPEAGTGWGNTIINDLPGLRIDQIWVSKHFRPVRVFALKTRHSDHRMVVCDLLLETNTP